MNFETDIEIFISKINLTILYSPILQITKQLGGNPLENVNHPTSYKEIAA